MYSDYMTWDGVVLPTGDRECTVAYGWLANRCRVG